MAAFCKMKHIETHMQIFGKLSVLEISKNDK